jgi:multisubunit Na+/H+ antiporter MnhF subunit
MLLAEGYHRSFLFDLALMLALLSFGGGMVFVRFLELWL